MVIYIWLFKKIYTNIDLIILVPLWWMLEKKYLEAKRKENDLYDSSIYELFVRSWSSFRTSN